MYPQYPPSKGALVLYKGPGRPTAFTPEIGREICLRLAVDGVSLRRLCEMADMPALRTLMNWVMINKETEELREFRQQYARAMRAKVEIMVHDTIEIADDGSNDWMERELEGGKIVLVADHEHIARSKLRIDTRKWVASKVYRKLYGDKPEEGAIEGGELSSTPSPDAVNDRLSERDRGRRLAFVLAKGLQTKESA